MIYDLPEDVRRGLETARSRDLERKFRLRVKVGDDYFPVLRLWESGFSLEVETAPQMRGYVDIYDGSRQLYQCLVICSSVENGERVFEFKRSTAVTKTAPVDFVIDHDAPVALLS